MTGDQTARVRSDLITGMYGQAQAILARLGADQHTVVGFDGGGYGVETKVRTMPAADVRHLSRALAELTNAAIRLQQVESGSDGERIGAALGRWFDDIVDRHGDDYSES